MKKKPACQIGAKLLTFYGEPAGSRNGLEMSYRIRWLAEDDGRLSKLAAEGRSPSRPEAMRRLVENGLKAQK